MSTRTSSVGRFIRDNLVVAFVLLSVLFVDLFVLFLLQEKVRGKKKEIITTNFIDQLDQASNDAAKTILQKMAVDAPQEELHAIAEGFLQQDNMFYRFEFYPFISVEEKIPSRLPTFVHEVAGKQSRLNTFQNCLFTRDFSHNARFRKEPGMFYVYYATPQDSPEIEWEIQKYRLYAALFVLFSFVLVIVMLRQIVLPLRRVSRSLDNMSEEFIPILDKPAASIEVAYNSMARNARLTQLGVLLGELVGDAPEEMLRGEDPVVETARKIPRIICDYMNFGRVVLFHRDEPSGLWEWGYGYDIEAGELTLPETFAEKIDLERLAQEKSGRLVSSEDLGWAGEIAAGREGTLKCALVPLFHNNRPICHAALWPVTGRMASDQLLESAENVRGEIEELFLKIISRRALLDKEKNEVSIHLSTNLGHDMTNILATSKWDLDTIKKGFDLDIVKIQGQPVQEERYKEAVLGLLDNTRMLQEVVNIYRAFGYARRPAYEKVDVYRQIQELAHLFELSTSKSVSISFDFKADSPCWVIEPRMIRLALFNLLSNSVQSISKMLERGEETSGEIVIQSEITREGWLGISILDGGTGLRNEEGNPMSPSELRRIFRYGFTTKRDEARGGLGLSWVWTIITEFHQGQIIPANRPEGGARMTILIPPLDHKLTAQDETAKADLPMM